LAAFLFASALNQNIEHDAVLVDGAPEIMRLAGDLEHHSAVMADIRPEQRGVMAGMLNLARNLGLITGASVMGAVFALASATLGIATAGPEAVATGMRITFTVAAMLIVTALAIAVGSRGLAARPSLPRHL
jgi:MFS family permease